MDTAADLLVSQLGKPALDQVQPAAGGRGEVQNKAGVRLQPAFDRRGLVRGGVVQDQVHVEIGGDFLLECVEELLELDSAVAGVQPADHFPGGDVQSGVEAGCRG